MGTPAAWVAFSVLVGLVLYGLRLVADGEVTWGFAVAGIAALVAWRAWRGDPE